MTLLYEAVTAYLGPLLKKHAAGQPLLWEDLVASQAASSAVLRQSKNEFVSSRLVRLHQSQVKAYQDAASKSIQEWATSFPLQPMEEDDTKTAFVERCVAAIENTNATGTKPLPNWKVESAKETAILEIRKRAMATYDKYHPVEDDNAEPANGSNDGEDDGSNEEDGEIDGAETEDGEMTADDVSIEDGETETTGKQTTTKPASNAKRQQKNAGNKKTFVARKKGTKAKGVRSTRGGRGGARRGGRGGGNRK